MKKKINTIKKMAIAALVSASVITPVAATVVPVTVQAATKNGWKNENGGWKYYKNGKAYTGWHKMGKAEGEKTEHWSYFGKDGKIYTGWRKMGKAEGEKTVHWSYFGPNGWLQTGWQQLGKGTSNPDGNAAKHWSYFGPNGWLRTGWQQMGKGTSNPDGNAAKHWSYFGSNGWLRTGWQQMGKGTSNPDGNAAKHWSYFGGNGWLRTGMVTLGKADGEKVTHKSYFGSNGWLVTNKTFKLSGKTYKADGRGWIKYSDASISPALYPEDVWSGIYKIEVRLNNGSHIYLPSFFTGWFYEGIEPHGNYGYGMYVIDSVRGNYYLNYSKYVGNKVYYGKDYFKVNANKVFIGGQESIIDIAIKTGSKMPTNDKHHMYRKIGNVGGKIYYIEFSTPDSILPYGAPAIVQNEYYEEFAEKIVKSAWVE